MQFTAKVFVQAVVLVAFMLVVVLGSAYVGAKVALDYAQDKPMHYLLINDPPVPCPYC